MAGVKIMLIVILLLIIVVSLEGITYSRRRRRRRRSTAPVTNCVWSTWSNPQCTNLCGNSGIRIRQRTRIGKASSGGTECIGDSTKTVPCNRFCYNDGVPMNGFCSCQGDYSGNCCSECTVNDCKWGEWGSWSECAPDCGFSRHKTRNRVVLQEATCGGSPCLGTSTDITDCEPICLNDGNAGTGGCQCVTPYSGDCCETCNPVNCTWNEWNEWTPCAPDCGGNRQRTRVRQQSPAMCDGSACAGADTESKVCDSLCYNGGVSSEGHCNCSDGYTGLCCETCVPLNCTWETWQPWSSCQPTCGNNRTRTRRRAVSRFHHCGGSCDLSLTEETDTCVDNCQNGGSPMYGHCVCTYPFSGICCEKCNLVNCEWSSWESWSICDPFCGAVRNRIRSMSVVEINQCGGTECGSQPIEISPCLPVCFNGGTPLEGDCQCTPSHNGSCCESCIAIDCVWEEWSSWSSCVPECGPERLQTRTRKILTPEKCGGSECSGETHQNQTCPPLCFNGGTPTNGSCDCPPLFNGVCCGSCEPKDCHWEAWQAWSSCQPRCGTNRHRKRVRSLLAHAACEGLCPGSSEDVITCNDTCEHDGTPMHGHCLCQRPYSGTCCETCIPSDCLLTSWNQWSGCSPDCGANRTRTRTRSIDHEAECGGLECDDELTEQESCSSVCHHGGVATGDSCRCHSPYRGSCCEQCEAVDCERTEWTSWSTCLPVCGNNRFQSKTRLVTKQNYCGGQCVGNNTMTRSCESICYNGGNPVSSGACQCPVPFSGPCCETCTSVNCTWGSWEHWSACQPKCGGIRQRNRIRSMEKQPVCGGTCSSSPFETETCEPLCFNGGTPVDGHCLCPFPFSSISCCQFADGDPCVYHTILNNRWRSIGNSELVNISTCDVNMDSNNWYRFSSVGGSEMIDSCVTIDKCGVHLPVWLKGNHPPTPGHEVQRHACVSESKDGVTKCCEHKTIVTVRKCSDFYIYQLPAVRSCEEGYCVGKESPCPSGTNSSSGYSPNCFAPSPKLSEPQLYLEETSEDGFRLLCVFTYPTSQNVSFDVIWSSEKDELHRETVFESRKSILSRSMIDDKHLLIYCKITAKFLYEDGTDKSTPSTAISSRSILLSTEELEIQPDVGNKTNQSEPKVSSRTEEDECCDNSGNYTLPIGIGVGVCVLIIITIFTIITIKNKRIIAPSSKLFILNSNVHGSCEGLHSETDEDNCNTMF